MAFFGANLQGQITTICNKNVRINPGNSRAVDFARADKMAGYRKQNPISGDYTWHHDKDTGYIQLVPTDIHGAVRHTGGIANGK